MAFSRFQAGTLIRAAGLGATLVLLAWMATHTNWYVGMGLVILAAIGQAAGLVQFATRSAREVARFLDCVAFDDTSASFSGLARDSAFTELSAAMTRVMDRLRAGRAEHEEQAQYLQTLMTHVPVALVSLDENGGVEILNMAARRLFGSACTRTSQFAEYGPGFAVGLESLRPGESDIVRMERVGGALQLKAAATAVVLGGVRHRLISLQNIEAELTAQELDAWQTVIRVMAHEVMNSLTPISSLATTAKGLVDDTLAAMPPEDADRANLTDAAEALETMARRSEGLLHFVQNHRRLTKRMVTQIETVSVRRVFARLQRLLAAELAVRNIQLTASVTPETLEIAVDAELLDQALINLVRNAMEALKEESEGRIALSAVMAPGGKAVLAVADNGPGITTEQREKVFVPFYTTKRQGSGIGLTLVRQIATVHGAGVSIFETPGGGATVSLRF